jgi:hypothetical protein
MGRQLPAGTDSLANVGDSQKHGRELVFRNHLALVGDGFGAVSSLNSRIAVAVPIPRTFAICRQLRPWSLSRRNAHLGRARLWQARQYRGQMRLVEPGAAEAVLRDFMEAIRLGLMFS